MFLCRAVSTFPNSRRFLSSNSGLDLAKAIKELNQEMEYVFGEAPPCSTLRGSPLEEYNTIQDTEDSRLAPSYTARSESSAGLTHTSLKGEAQMVDISSKEVSKRIAIASCKVILGQKAFDLVSANQMQKGDVLSVAKLAGISGAKQTSNLIPLCHNINLTHVRVDLSLNPKDFSVKIVGEAASTGKTGVEMEAMTATAVAGLTVYDMCKAASKGIQITDIRLEHKCGGKSGDWSREEALD